MRSVRGQAQLFAFPLSPSKWPTQPQLKSSLISCFTEAANAFCSRSSSALRFSSFSFKVANSTSAEILFDQLFHRGSQCVLFEVKLSSSLFLFLLQSGQLNL